MADFFDVPELIIKRIQQANTNALKKLGEDIKRVGSLNNYRDAQLIAAKLTGKSVFEITRELSEASGMTNADIEKLYTEAAGYDYEFAEQFYLTKEQIPYEENKLLQRTVKSLVKASQDDCFNLSHSYAFALRDPDGRTRVMPLAAGYKEAIDKAITAVKLGTTDYNAEMRRILSQYAESGIRTVDWQSGYSQRIDTAVRRNIMDGLRRVKIETQKIIGEDFGANGYEISAHMNPAPDHADIQGRQYSFEDFDILNMSLKRRIGELNCYHTVTAIILGVSAPVYTEKQLREMKQKSEELIDIDGKKYSRYDCTQLQRKLETKIRRLKDKKAMLQAAGDDVGVRECNRKIRLAKEKYNSITQKAGLDPRYNRMNVVKASNNIIKELHRNKNITHRKISESGKKIIDNATYNKLTKDFISRDGIIIRGEEADKHLGESHSAAYLPSLNTAFIRDDATVSDVLEEMYHAEQDRNNLYGSELNAETVIKREIDAQKYLISVSKKYKIPLEETEETKRLLVYYENQLKELE